MNKRFEPKLMSVFREGYSSKLFFGDLTAGVITGIVALPLAIAFGIASGATPAQGLYTAIIAGFIISILSGSRVQIGGPTGAFIVVVYGVIQAHGVDGLILATLMAGIMLIGMGLLRLGEIIKFIPYPVTVGFTTGIAVIIGVTQVRDLLGLKMQSEQAGFTDKISAYAHSINTLNPWAVSVGAITVAIILFWPRVSRRIPSSLVAIICCTLLVYLLKLPVETIGSRFGEMPSGLPTPRMPEFNMQRLKELFPASITIALLGAIESLLSAVVADGMTGRRHRSNMELIAQGVANVVTPLFGGIPATGAIARTATNIKNGGRTPFAGIFHAITLLLIVLCLGGLARLIPMAVLGGILVMVAVNMSEYRLFVKMFRAPKSDVAILLCTFGLTVFVDLTVAIQVGMVMAAFLFMRRIEQVSGAGIIQSDETKQDDEREDPFALCHFDVPDGVEVYEINGPFFFGAAKKFQDSIDLVEEGPKVLILRMRNVPAIDATGLFSLEAIAKRAHSYGTFLLISGIHEQPLNAMRKAGLDLLIGVDHIHGNIADALTQARIIIDKKSSEGR